MKNMPYLALPLIALVLGGCGGSYTVTRMHGKLPEQLRSVAFAPQPGNSPEVTGYVSEALAARGVGVKGEAASAGFRTQHADGVVSYVDVWRWDMAMYLKSLKINLYNASSGELLVSGRWEDSLFHAWHRGEAISKELLARMFEQLNLPAVDSRAASVMEATPVATGPSEARPAGSERSEAEKSARAVSRNEYAAREQARLLQCSVQEVLAVEGLGSPREELTFACGAGRRITIVCRTGAGCS